MGSPKKQRKKFSKPTHPWQGERILAEKEVLKEYGLNRKYEIWKMNSILKTFTRQAKNLIAAKNPQGEKERNQLLTKLSSLGLINKNAKIEDVLSLTLKNVMERRLQTIVYKKSIANTIRQARQFIVHQHISIGDKAITTPSYLVPLDEEGIIQFAQNSAFSSPAHPERVVADKKQKEAKEKDAKKEARPKVKKEFKKEEKEKKKADQKDAVEGKKEEKINE